MPTLATIRPSRRWGTRQKQIQGSVHCATDDDAVRRFGRDDVFLSLQLIK
jgi:hypothetical protein